MRLEARKYLYDIQRAAAMLRAAVEREFEIIGEAMTQLAKVDKTVAGRISHHGRIIAFRNVLIHQYGDVDDRLVWNVVETHLLLSSVRSRPCWRKNDGSAGLASPPPGPT